MSSDFEGLKGFCRGSTLASAILAFSFLVLIAQLKLFICLPMASVVFLFTCMCSKCVSGSVHGVNMVGMKMFVVFIS